MSLGTNEALWTFLGRLHPLLLHFPIGLILVAGLVELWAGLRGCTSPVARTCLTLGAFSALLAAGSGWLFAEEHTATDTLYYHRWTGIAAAVVACLAGFLAPRGEEASPRRAHRIMLLAAVVLVAATGHLGGDMVYGDDFLFAPFEESTDGAGEAAPSEGAPAGADVPLVDFTTEVQPILAERCYECHGPTKSKGKLRLDDVGALFARDPTDWVVYPFVAEISPLYERVSLPHDDLDIMPAKGDPLSPEQIATIRAWIDQGARHPD